MDPYDFRGSALTIRVPLMTFCFNASDNHCLRVYSKLLIIVAVVSVLACHCSFAILQSFTFPDNFESAFEAISLPQLPLS